MPLKAHFIYSTFSERQVASRARPLALRTRFLTVCSLVACTCHEDDADGLTQRYANVVSAVSVLLWGVSSRLYLVSTYNENGNCMFVTRLFIDFVRKRL